MATDQALSTRLTNLGTTRGGAVLRGCASAFLAIVIAFLASLVPAVPAGAQGSQDAIQRFTISQSHQTGATPPAVRVYLDAQTASGDAVSELAASRITSTLGSFPTRVGSPRLFDSADGIAYSFLVDISKSLRQNEFMEMRAAIDSWVARLGERDRVSLYSFGSSSRLLVDWTGRFDDVRSALSRLGPTDQQTLLNQALADALASSDRKDSDLPGRRAIVVLSDGRDEGSALALEDILARVRSSPTPIYTIGFSPSDRANRERDLDVLRRLASNSGGSFYEANATSLTEAYREIERAITRVWQVDLVCDRCLANGNEYRLQVDLETQGRVLSNGTQLRLLPSVGRTPASRVEEARAALGENRSEPMSETVAQASEGVETLNAQRVDESSIPRAQPPLDNSVDEPGRGLFWFLSARSLLFFWLPLALGLGLLVAGILSRSQHEAEFAQPEGLQRSSLDSFPRNQWTGESEKLYRSKDEEPDHGDHDGSGAESGSGAGLRNSSSSFSLSLPKAGTGPQEGSSDSGAPRGPLDDPTSQFPVASLESSQGLQRAANPAQDSPSPLPSLRPQAASTIPVVPAPMGRGLYSPAPRVVRFVVLRGRNKGKQYRALLRERMIVGSRSTADLVLSTESNLGPEQFRLEQNGSDIVIANVDTTKPTLLNGLELEKQQKLHSGDLVGNGDVILRVVLGD